MTKDTALGPLAAVVLVLSTCVAVAQDVPTLDVGRLCRAEAKAAPGFSESCMADESRARDDLVRQWAQFAPDSKASCMHLATGISGAQSYVELLTCLQMKSDVRSLPKQ